MSNPIVIIQIISSEKLLHLSENMVPAVADAVNATEAVLKLVFYLAYKNIKSFLPISKLTTLT